MPLKGNEIDLEENKNAYEKKMARQLKESESAIKQLLKVAKDRNAMENSEVKRLLDELKGKMDTAREKYDALKDEQTDMWPEGSRDVSSVYKELQDLLNTTESKIKRK